MAGRELCLGRVEGARHPHPQRSCLTNPGLCLLDTYCALGPSSCCARSVNQEQAATAWGRRFQLNLRSQSKMLGHLGPSWRRYLGRSSGGAKHVQMRVQKKGSREEEQELRWGLEVIYFSDSAGSTV